MGSSSTRGHRKPLSSSLRVPIAITVATSAVVRYLGFVIDADLSMAPQVANACRSAYYHLARIARVRNSITTGVCKCLVHAFVTSRIDYGNAIVFGTPNHLMHRLEMVQRSAARIILQIRRGDRQSMSEVLRQLRWLPVRKRTEYKLLVLVHCALYEGTPVYLALLLHRHTPRHSLRSAGDLLLQIPRVNLGHYDRGAVACAGLTLWNNGIAHSSERH